MTSGNYGPTSSRRPEPEYQKMPPFPPLQVTKKGTLPPSTKETKKLKDLIPKPLQQANLKPGEFRGKIDTGGPSAKVTAVSSNLGGQLVRQKRLEEGTQLLRRGNITQKIVNLTTNIQTTGLSQRQKRMKEGAEVIVNLREGTLAIPIKAQEVRAQAITVSTSNGVKAEEVRAKAVTVPAIRGTIRIAHSPIAQRVNTITQDVIGLREVDHKKFQTFAKFLSRLPTKIEYVKKTELTNQKLELRNIFGQIHYALRTHQKFYLNEEGKQVSIVSLYNNFSRNSSVLRMMEESPEIREINQTIIGLLAVNKDLSS